jgi:tetratricopeptide (TPR) repeat protein
MARCFEQSDTLPEAERLRQAEQQYQAALKDKPDHLAALLGYAQLKERAGNPEEALQLYQRAVKSHPQEASVHNNIGLCYARQNRLDEALAAMSRAIQMEPKNRLYRNNIATVLVDQGRIREAFDHLREAHGDAAAHYNLGYLLNKKGQTQPAMEQFALALKADPSLDAARRWVDYLQATTAPAQSAKPAAVGQPIAKGPIMPSDSGLLLPEEPRPRRLPPIALRQPQRESPPLPGISYERPTAQTAPLPPPSASSPMLPLPRPN